MTAKERRLLARLLAIRPTVEAWFDDTRYPRSSRDEWHELLEEITATVFERRASFDRNVR
jgi:hypothetical protein